MADMAELYDALKQADKAGDKNAAAKIAAYIGQQESTSRKSPIAAMDSDPTSGMSGWQKFVAGYGKAGSDIVKGVGQRIGDAAELVSGKRPKFLPNAADVAATRQQDAPLTNSGAGMGGNVVGNLAAFAPLAALPGANAMHGAAAYGALTGALQPSESASETGKNAMAGGAMSGAITGAARAVPALWSGLVKPFTGGGQEELALTALNRFAKDPNAIKTAGVNELVPGSKPSLAEVTGDPGIAQFQRAARAKSPEVANMFADAHTERLQARKDALLNIAGSHDDKEFFEIARQQTAQRLYGDAFKAKLNPKTIEKMQPEVEDLLARPSIKQARKEAIDIALEEGKKLEQSDIEGQGSIKGMHYMKKALDSQISKAKSSGDDNQVRLLKGTQDKLVAVMQRLSPKYAEAMAEYQAASKPLNTMEVGRYLYDKLVPAATDVGAERLTPQRFIAALKDGDKMAAKATGFKGAKLADILSTDQLDTVVNLAKDLGREIAATERGKVPGSPTAQYVAAANIMRQVLGPLGLPEKWLEKVVQSTVAETIGRWKTFNPLSIAEEKIQNNMGRMLVDPRFAQSAAARSASSANKMAPLHNASRYAVPAAAVTGSSAYNSMAPQ